jgi:ATP phosphoribosyltransferase
LTAGIVFIVVPKNSGLRKYREIGLSMLTDAPPERLVEVRGEDVPLWIEQLLAKGERVIGMTGEDLYREYFLEEREPALKILKRIAWNDPDALYGKPALCLLGPSGKRLEDMPKSLVVGVPPKYQKIAKRYLNFLERKGFSFKKTYINGSIETSCSRGITDLAIDIVYTGSTMYEQGLRVYDKIMESDFVIIGGKGDD